jgi:hypothetical protein
VATPHEVAALLKFMKEFYGERMDSKPDAPRWVFDPSKAVAAFWAKLLADVPSEALLPAFEQYVSTGQKYPPNAGELRQIVLGVTRLDCPSVGEAWDEVMRAIRSVGSWGTPTWSHPAIERAVANMGGWRVLCAMETDDTATHRAQFRDIYNSIVSRAEHEQAMTPSLREVRDRLAAPRRAGEILAGLLMDKETA